MCGAVLTLAAVNPAVAADAAPAPTSSASPPASSRTAPNQNATFGIQPVTNGRVDGRPNFSYQTGPGGAYQDSFAVVNYSAKPLRLQVYAADLTNNGDGGLAVGSATDPKQGAASWLRLPTGLTSVVVAASGTKTGPGLVRIPFAWAVPTGAAAGDHSAALVASLSVQGTGKNGQRVRLDQRVALRVFFRVSGAVKAQLSVSGMDVTYSGTWNPVGSGTARVTYKLTNTGNVRLGAKQTLTTSAWFGAGGTPSAIADQPLLLPGASVRVSAAVRNVFPGVRLTGKLHVVPVRAVDDTSVVTTPFSTEASTGAIPWPLIVAIAVLLVLVALLARWRHQRRKQRPASKHGSRRAAVVGAQ